MTDEMTIQELCDQVGLPRRTIHFYIQQQILPPPQGLGLAARYNQEHLVRLKLVPVLREQGYRLDDIRQKFQDCDLAELRGLLPSDVPRHPLSPPSPSPQRISPRNASYTAFTLKHGILLLVPQGLLPEMDDQLQQALKFLQEKL